MVKIIGKSRHSLILQAKSLGLRFPEKYMDYELLFFILTRDLPEISIPNQVKDGVVFLDGERYELDCIIKNSGVFYDSEEGYRYLYKCHGEKIPVSVVKEIVMLLSNSLGYETELVELVKGLEFQESLDDEDEKRLLTFDQDLLRNLIMLWYEIGGDLGSPRMRRELSNFPLPEQHFLKFVLNKYRPPDRFYRLYFKENI